MKELCFLPNKVCSWKEQEVCHMKPASVKDEEELKESARALSWFGICYYTVLLWPGVPQTHVSPWSHETDHFSVGKTKACGELLLQHGC